MNRKCECYATISPNDPRHKFWIQITKDGKIPLKHPLPHRTSDGIIWYEGDPFRLSRKQWNKMAEILSKKFNIEPDEIIDDLYNGVLPIKADNVTVSICNLHFRCMM